MVGGLIGLWSAVAIALLFLDLMIIGAIIGMFAASLLVLAVVARP